MTVEFLPPLEDGIIALGYALLHFIWQGVVIGMLCYGLLWSLRNATAATRYAVALGGLISLALAPVLTWCYLVGQPGMTATVVAAEPWGVHTAEVARQTLQGTSDSGIHSLTAVMPWVVCAWLAGVVVMSFRLWSDGRFLLRLRKTADRDVPPVWRDRLEIFCARLNLPAHRIGLAISNRIGSPFVVGFLRPVILFPAALVNRMPIGQLEMILAHEIAHIRRYDHLINLIQVALETFLFYHPVVRILSARVRAEREHCTDDMALSIVGDRVRYARSLAELEHFRSEILAFGVGAAHGDLRQRINRILNSRLSGQRGLVGIVMASFLAMASILMSSALFWSDPLDDRAPDASADMATAETRSRTISDASTTTDALDGAIPYPDQPGHTGSSDGPGAPPVSAMEGEGPVVDTGLKLAGGMAPERETSAAPSQSGSVPEPPPTRDAASAPDAAVSSGGSEPEGVPAASEEAAAEPSQPPAAATITDPPVVNASERNTTTREDTRRPGGDAPAQLAMATVPSDPKPEPVETGGNLLTMVQPEYPMSARRRSVEGEVHLAYTVTPEGRVTGIEILETDHPRYRLDRAARQAVSEWRYEPFRVDGEPVARRIRQIIEFSLEGGPNPEACMPVTGSRLDPC